MWPKTLFATSVWLLWSCGAANGDHTPLPQGDRGPLQSIDDCVLSDAPYAVSPYPHADHRVRFENTTEQVSVEIARTFDGQGGGISAKYVLGGFGLERNGAVLCVSDSLALEYENTHHNMRDIAVMVHETTRYELEMFWMLGSQAVWTFTLHFKDTSTGNEVEPALLLVER
ncbi:hypothetical protein ACFL6C_04200 [Myxococcota bacterium]